MSQVAKTSAWVLATWLFVCLGAAHPAVGAAGRPAAGRPAAGRPAAGDPAPEYLVVTTEALAPEFAPLIAWKTAKGVPATVRTVEWIDGEYLGADTQERVRRFLQEAVAVWGARWLLIGGDTDHVPARYVRSVLSPAGVQEFPADLYYGCLDGNWNANGNAHFGEANPPGFPAGGDQTDFEPELYVGRAPVSTVAEARRFVERVLGYERQPPRDNRFGGAFLLLGERLSHSLDGAQLCEQVADLAPPWAPVTRLYESHAQFPGALPLNAVAARDSINAGPAFLVHVGHGFRNTMSTGTGSLDNRDVDALGNGARLPCIFAINCSSSAFDFESIAERFLLHPTGGAIAFIGMSRNAYPGPTQDYQNAFFRRVLEDSVLAPGEALVGARLEYVDRANPGETAHRWTQLGLNLLGDPETPLWTRPPTVLSLEHAAEVPLGAPAFQVRVTGNGAPLAGARVCLLGDDAYAVATTGADGWATLALAAQAPGTVLVTATAGNAIPVEGSAQTVAPPGPFLAVAAVTIADPPPGGNGDGRAAAGETVTLRARVENRGGGVAQAGWVELTGHDPVVTVVGEPVFLPDLAPGASVEAGVVVEVGGDAQPRRPVAVEWTLASSAGTVAQVAKLAVHAPVLVFDRHWLDDPPPGGNWNGSPEPGERVVYGLALRNLGDAPATDVWVDARIVSRVSGVPSPDVHLPVATVAIGAVLAGERRSAPAFEFALSPEAVPRDLVLELTVRQGFLEPSVSHHDWVPPPPPVGLTTRGSAERIRLSWEPVLAGDLWGYDVYRSPGLAGPFERLNAAPLTTASSFEDSRPPQSRWYYCVAARDSSGNSSRKSLPVVGTTSPRVKSGWPLPLASESAAAPLAAQLDGAPGLEVVAVADAIYVWHADGSELRDGDGDATTSGVFTTDGQSDDRGFLSTPAIGDLDLDGNLDIVALGWDTGQAYAWNAAGERLSGWPQDVGGRFSWGSPVVVDLDLDGAPEVVAVGGHRGDVYAWRATGVELTDGDENPDTHGILYRTGAAFLYSSPAVGDVTGDRLPEVVVATNGADGQLAVLDAAGNQPAGFPRALGGQITASPALADLDGDGRFDIIVAAETDSVYAVSGEGAADLPGWPQPATVFTAFGRTSSPVVGDLDADGALEVIFAASDGVFRAWDAGGQAVDGLSGRRFSDTMGDATQAVPAVADLDGDGALDVVVGDENGRLTAVDATGGLLDGFPIMTDAEVRGGVMVWDVDEDGALELGVSGFNRRVTLWDLEAPLDIGLVAWPFLRHDLRNSGSWAAPFLGVGVGPVAEAPVPLVVGAPVPNPSRGPTTLNIHLGATARPVRLGIYDVSGRLVERLVDGARLKGAFTAQWDGLDWRGQRVASGVYFWRLEAGERRAVRRLTVLR